MVANEKKVASLVREALKEGQSHLADKADVIIALKQNNKVGGTPPQK